MNAKFGNFSEMASLLSVKSRVSGDLTALYARFSLEHLLSRMGMKKEQGYSLVQFIMAICIFRVCGETIQPICHVFMVWQQQAKIAITACYNALPWIGEKAFEIYQMRWSIEVLNK